MKETAAYEKVLLAEQERLETELASIGRRNPANPADWEALPEDTGQEADEGDAAENIEGYAANTAVLNELEVRYNEVLAALARIKDGTYGTCMIGGEAIEKERLAANPAAATCLTHANA